MKKDSENKPQKGTEHIFKRILQNRKDKEPIPAIYFSLGLLLLLVIFFSFGSMAFLSSYNILTIGMSASILLAVGLGQTCVILTGGIDLSVGGMMSLVSVILMILLRHIGFWAYPVSIAVGVTAGLINGLLNAKLRIPSFITTLGTNGIFVSIAYLISARPLSAPLAAYDVMEFVNGSFFGIQNIIIIGAVTFLLFFVFQRYTITGRSIMLMGSNEKMSWLSGVNVFKIRAAAFTLSGLGAGIAGILLASNLFSGYPTIGNEYILKSIATVVVGGTAMTGGAGGALNTLVGALVLSVISNGMNIVGIDVYAQQTFLGVLVIIAAAVSFDRSKLTIIK